MTTGPVVSQEVEPGLLDAAVSGDPDARAALIETEEFRAAMEEYLKLPFAVRSANESLSVLFADMGIRAEFFLLRDYDDEEGIMDILICGENVTGLLSNFNLKSLESATSFLLSYKLGGRHISITLSAAETPPWEEE